ncbi:MAG: ATP phosphoribosyltransferase [Abditibacteriales bacterium]|nr:ATP phosphoribosyltransferase [Abditibacteriales bacterium]MDW8367473.1 ATP phosphoribosyltransferase [Abditibacteriales bacterium]
MKLRIGLPKGSLQEATVRMLGKAGYKVTVESRSYYPHIDDPELEGVLIRAQEIPRYVQDGIIDCGITGEDWVQETEADVVRAAELVYSKQTNQPARWVVAVHHDAPFQGVEDLQGKRVATELVNVTRKFLQSRGVTAHVEFSWGATEVKVPDLVDAIVEITETGSSLRANNLRIIETVMTTTTQLIANRQSWQDDWKRRKVENLALLLLGAIAAEDKVILKMNAPRARLKDVLAILPAMKNPTVANLSDEAWVAVEAVVDEKVVRELIPQLKEVGASGIIELPLNKVIP